MKRYSFTPPICLSCGIALEKKIMYNPKTNNNQELSYCPNCREVYD